MFYQTSNQERIRLGFGDLECNNGVHLCGFYETPEERDAVIFGFIRQGFKDHAHVLYAPAQRSLFDFHEKFHSMYPDIAIPASEHHCFTLTPALELYYDNGVFSPGSMMAKLEKYYRQTQNEHRHDIRATSEMSWAIDSKLDRKHLMAYESHLNYFIPGKPWISICMYDLSRFDGQTIMQVLQTHPYSLVRGEAIIKNPYYMDPDEWLATYAPEYALSTKNQNEKP